jgi:hypothetical protein
MRLHVNDLESAAMKNKDGISNVQVRSLWMTCKYDRKKGTFSYRYGVINITREGAIIILDDG